MAHRAYWKGFLRLSLVSIAVEVYNAVDTKSEISFRQIHKPSGRRINYTKTVQGIGEVDNADIVKGYEVNHDQYVTLEPEELEALKLESSKTIELVKFVDASAIDPRYFERPYYLGPGDKNSGEGYAVIRDALRETGKAGLGQMTIGGREWLVAITSLDDGLAMIMLRYADELKDAAVFFDEVPSAKPDKEMVDLAVELIKRKSGSFKPEEFENHYVAALKELIDKKMKGRKIVAPPEEHEPRTRVTDLMSALKKSIGEVPEKPRVKAGGAPAQRRQASRRRSGAKR
jgi:DNA end-binding protein Ku